MDDEDDKVPLNPFDIDSKDFNPKMFYDFSIRQYSVNQLVAKEKSNLAEIALLNDDIQMLLYNNYSKIINASKVVNMFEENIDKISTKISLLNENLTNVAIHSDKFGESLKEKHQQINKLVGVKDLLKKVDFISNLEKHLKECLVREKYATAVNMWVNVKKFLQNQNQFPSFSKIYQSCLHVIQEIDEMIREDMLNIDTPSERSVMDGLLLIKLGNNSNVVLSQLVQNHFIILDHKYSQFQFTDEPFSDLANLNTDIINFSLHFLNGFQEHLQEYQEKVDYLEDFKSSAFSKLVVYFPVQKLYDLETNKLIPYLNLFSSLLSTCMSVGLINYYVDDILKQYGTKKRVAVVDKLKKIISDESPEYVINDLRSVFAKELGMLINDLNILYTSEFTQTVDCFQQNMAEFFDHIFKFFENEFSEKSLMFSIFAYNISMNNQSWFILQDEAVTINVDIDLILKQVVRQAAQVSKTCLVRYVDYTREFVSSLANELIPNYQGNIDNIPSDSSECVNKLIHELNNLWDALLLKIPSSSSYSDIDIAKKSISMTYINPLTKFSFTGVRSDGFQQIDRMFVSVSNIMLNKYPKLDASEIYTSIVVYALKCVLETVREAVFSKYGFNQIQIDFYTIYQLNIDRISEKEVFGVIIEEIIYSGFDRSLEPNPFSVSQLDDIFKRLQA